MQLTVRPTASHYGVPTTSAADDYVVLRGEKVVGRIYRTEGVSWLWVISTFRQAGVNGLANTREAALLAFKAAIEAE